MERAREVILHKFKTDYKKLVHLSFLQYQAGQVEEAIKRSKMAIELKPKEALGYNNLGFLHLFTGDTAAAFSNLKHSVELDKTYSRARYNLGAYYFTKGNDTEGIAEYKQAISLDPTELHDHLDDLKAMKKQHPDWAWVDRAVAYLASAYSESAT